MGDVPNAAERVRKLARALQFPDARALNLERGDVRDLLRLLHFALLDSSRALAAFLLEKGYDLRGKTDMRFVEGVFRLLRDEFRYFPALSAAQFLSPQFVERRLLLAADALALAARKRKELQRQRRQQDAVWTRPNGSKAPAAAVDNHVLPPEVVDHAAVLLERLNAMQSGRSDAASGRRVRASRVRLRGAQASASSADKRQEMQTDRESWSWKDGGSDQSVGSGGRGDGRPDVAIQSVNDSLGPPQETARCSNSQSQPSPPPHQPSVEQALAAITQQLAGLSDTLVSKISSVEGRLEAVETRVSGLHASLSQLQQEQRARTSTSHEAERVPSSNGVARSPGSDAFEKRRAHGDSACAWPPPPAMFERY